MLCGYRGVLCCALLYADASVPHQKHGNAAISFDTDLIPGFYTVAHLRDISQRSVFASSKFHWIDIVRNTAFAISDLSKQTENSTYPEWRASIHNV